MKSLGHIESITTDITSPISLKTEDMVLRDLVMFTGKNGVGKSFVNALIYATTTVVNYHLIMKTNLNLNLTVDDIFSKCFDNKICGFIKIKFTSKSFIEINLDEEGFCNSVSIHLSEKELEPVKVTYMSSEFRLFSHIKSYLLLRDAFPGSDIDKVDKMANLFKLYDVQTMEDMIINCPFTFKKEDVDRLVAFGDGAEMFKELKSIDVDMKKSDYFITFNDGSIKYASQLAAGLQSLLSMNFIMSINKK